jgi:hypothetical protein
MRTFVQNQGVISFYGRSVDIPRIQYRISRIDQHLNEKVIFQAPLRNKLCILNGIP